MKKCGRVTLILMLLFSLQRGRQKVGEGTAFFLPSNRLVSEGVYHNFSGRLANKMTSVRRLESLETSTPLQKQAHYHPAITAIKSSGSCREQMRHGTECK